MVRQPPSLPTKSGSMALQPASSSGAFNSLPIELNKAIAHFIESDKDLFAFSLVCLSTRDAIHADNGSFWRARFREKFAMRKGTANEVLKKSYQRRMKHLRAGQKLKFFRGNRNREAGVILVLRDLICESFCDGTESDIHGRPRCRNLQVIKKFVYCSNLLISDDGARPTWSDVEYEQFALTMAMKIMCSQFMFEEGAPMLQVHGFQQSQYAVYLTTNVAPIYRGPFLTTINLEWIFHCLQFFRYHMMDQEAATLCAAMAELAPRMKPSAWQSSLKKGTYALGKHWKGTYSYLEAYEVRKLRSLREDQLGSKFFSDKNIDEGQIQTLELDFDHEEPLPWPRNFESRLHSLRNSNVPKVKAQGRAKGGNYVGSTVGSDDKDIQFSGSGVDLEDEFNAIGWLNPLPDQCGIPGWQRITFMKHFLDNLDQVEQDNLWAYEGVVLPGGRIILGRWWYASGQVDLNNDYSGPFILWAIDDPNED